MGLSPDALYSAVKQDVQGFINDPPVGDVNNLPAASYKQFVSRALLNDIIRKWYPEDTTLADISAKEKFRASNKKCMNWYLCLEDEKDHLLFSEFLREVDDFFHPNGNMLFSSYYDFIGMGRVGPGAAIGARGNSLYAKLFSSKLTVTSTYLYEMYKRYIEWFPTFSTANDLRSEKYGSHDVVTCSRSSFVPKTKEVSRMICVEPSVNMFCQLGLGAILEERLKSCFSIDLKTQPEVNRRLAQQGSKDNSYCTIDLSSASDSISLRLCELVFPKWFFQTLLELRSPSTMIDKVREPLFMISTMGNGFTFPLQTIIFSCLIRASYKVSGIPRLDGKKMNWACFGDDLIVVKESYPQVIRLLGLLGFSPNSTKTFFEGPFRESCGADWFNGQPARSVFVKRLRSTQDIFVAINLLNSWSAYTGIALINTIRYLLSGLSSSNRSCYVPFEENNDSGIRVPSAHLDGKLRRNRNLSILYRCFRARPKSIKVMEGEIHFPDKVKKLMFNPNGLHISFLYGELVSCMIHVRHDLILYRQKLVCTPRWDYIPVDSLTNGFKLSWRQWETAVLINLSNP